MAMRKLKYQILYKKNDKLKNYLKKYAIISNHNFKK